jgi:myo-inositol 2-dehydrogenase/D-chiro-inositol 1-dehydrogenase
VYGYDQRVEVFGSKGMVAISNNTPDKAVLSNAEGVHGTLPLFFFIERYTEAYAEEVKAFVACILNDTPPPVTGLDGRIPVVMGYAATKSYAEKRPVRLHEVEVGSQA